MHASHRRDALPSSLLTHHKLAQGPLPPAWETRVKLLALAWPRLGPLGVNQWTDKRDRHSLSPCHSGFPVKLLKQRGLSICLGGWCGGPVWRERSGDSPPTPEVSFTLSNEEEVAESKDRLCHAMGWLPLGWGPKVHMPQVVDT